MRRVVVTGIGVVSPLGVGVEGAWDALLNGCSGVHVAAWGEGLPSQVAATVPAIDEEVLRDCGASSTNLARFTKLGLVAATEALRGAGWDPLSMNRARAGAVIGSGIGAMDEILEAQDTLDNRGVNRLSPHFVPKVLINMAAGQVAIRHQLQGPCTSPATACAAGAHAIADACRILRCGEADLMVAGASESATSRLTVAGFSRLRALSTKYNTEPCKASRPFDAARDGFVIGEGAAILVLEGMDHALARGAPVVRGSVESHLSSRVSILTPWNLS